MRAAVAVVLHGVGQQVEQDLLEPLAVGVDVAMAPVRVDQLDLAGLGLGPDEVEALLDHQVQGDRLEGQGHGAGLDPGDVEHLVDELEQVAAALEDLAHGLDLGLVQLLQLEELGEAEDRVERRAQLVAHAGEELALGPVGPLGVVLGHAQGVVGAAPLGDVLGDAEQVGGLAVVAEERDLAGVQDPSAEEAVSISSSGMSRRRPRSSTSRSARMKASACSGGKRSWSVLPSRSSAR